MVKTTESLDKIARLMHRLAHYSESNCTYTVDEEEILLIKNYLILLDKYGMQFQINHYVLTDYFKEIKGIDKNAIGVILREVYKDKS